MALLIVGHPELDKSIANNAIIEEVKKHDLDIEIRYLHQLYPDYKIDINAEQAALLRHETIIFQYPFYWYNAPAILKLWFDEVFTYQFAYGSKGYKLKGKNFLLSFTVGAPQQEYQALGEHHFGIPEFCKNFEQTAYYAQMNYMAPIYSFGTSTAAGYKESEIRDKAKAHAKILVSALLNLK